jgi:transcriptional regulator with XRE-family HTH domain
MVIELPPIDPMQAALGRQMRRVREARGLDVHALAVETHIGAARIGLAEHGRVRLTSAELHAVIAALRIPLRLLHEPTADLSGLRRL